MNPRRVYLIIPTFNSASTIEATLISIQEQASGLERLAAVILSDDCSIDGTVRIAKNVWTASLPLIVLENAVNLGEWRNVNSAMASFRERVDWFLLLHADDVAKPRWLGEMVSRMEVCPDRVASVCCSWDTWAQDGTMKSGENLPGDASQIEGGDDAVRDTLHKGCWWHLSGCAIRANAFEDIGAFDERTQGDWDWLLRCLSRGWDIEYIPRSLIIYREHAGSGSAEVLQANQDVDRALDILARYRTVLGDAAYRTLVARRARFLARRLGRAMIQLSPRRVLGVSRSLIGVAEVYLRSFASPERDRLPK